MKKFLGLLMEEESVFIKNEAELDEPTFDSWKLELQKELPTFWASMKK